MYIYIYIYIYVYMNFEGMQGIDVTPPALVSQFLVCPSWRRAVFTRTQHPSKRFSREYLVSWGAGGGRDIRRIMIHRNCAQS